MQGKPSLEDAMLLLGDKVREEIINAHDLGVIECAEKLAPFLTRLIACADNGYDTAELHAIVKDAKKAVSE